MLQTTIKVTEDWPHGKQIYLFDDYNLSRLQEPLIKDRSDLPALRCLLGDPSTWQVDEFRTRASAYRKTADRLGVLLEGGWSSLGDSLMWLLGIERVLYLQTDDPAFLEEILDILLEWELKRLDYLLAEGIEVLVHMAWYETTDFWTPRNWRRLLKPRLFQLIRKAHSHGVKFRYIITKSWKPYRQDYLELGIDCLTGLDPVQDTVDLEEVKQQIGGQICLMGGVNSAVMLSQWNKSQIRWAVEHAMRSLSPGGGFILHPVDAVFNNQPWEKILYLIDCWRTVSLHG